MSIVCEAKGVAHALGVGLEAIADGFYRVARDDHDNMARQFPVYDALYAHCQARVNGW